MPKPKKNYELINRGDIRVVIKTNRGHNYHYPFEDIFELIEVDVQIEHDHLTIVKNHRGEEHWTYRLLRNMEDPLANWQGREQAVSYYASEESVTAAENQVRKNLRALRKLVKQAQADPIFQLMKPIADRVIKSYFGDFYFHDCMTLYRHKPEKFIWLVREVGSDLIIYRDSDYILKSEKGRGIPSEIYYFSGHRLTQITLEEAFNKVKVFPEFTLQEKK